MLKILKVRAHHVIDFAAEELKKYLRMMMPECGDVPILYDPNAKDGFRLGLLEDFSLPFEGENAFLDDVVHVDTDETGGILAGSNPRSVLFAVYRFFKENGCRWLYPGIDGEYIPLQDIVPIRYHKMASYRFRGHCNEGSESQTCMLETIDLYAKQEMNVYMLECFAPLVYYDRYYSHKNNEENRAPEPLTTQQVIQWKRMCETEINRRGLLFHDIGHGWTADPFGFQPEDRVKYKAGLLQPPKEAVPLLPLINGERKLFRNDPQLTNPCLSNPVAREKMARYVVEYAKNHSNSDYLHVWLADSNRNHCECEECRKMRPSDWYLMVMNRIDELLTEEGLDTRIVFIAYVDTLFPPEKVRLNNPDRFALLYASISSFGVSDFTDSLPVVEPLPYERNRWEYPSSFAETVAMVRAWREVFDGPTFSYGYHFCRTHYLDPGGFSIAKKVDLDVRDCKNIGMDGYIEDSTQRGFFPNGFAYYLYAEILLDRTRRYEDVEEDYFSHIYGSDWKEAVHLLRRISAAFDFEYMRGFSSENENVSKYYSPTAAKRLQAISELAAEERAFAEKHRQIPTRPQSISFRLLALHADYIDGVAEIFRLKALGHDREAIAFCETFFNDFGKHEMEIERYYDHGMAASVFKTMLKKVIRSIFEG